jgi:glycosyltransferase involved in cell wall biosynthesis
VSQSAKKENRTAACWGWLAHALTAFYQGVLRMAVRFGPPVSSRPARAAGLEILLTGTFYSENWLAAHLLPLADCPRVARLIVVATHPVPAHPKILWRPPPRWLARLLGEVPARLLRFFAVGLSQRPDWVGGFHLLFNGMAALLLARLIGARAMYFCVGGEAEVRDGGLLSENRLFARQRRAQPRLEQRLLDIVREFDLVLTMGSRAQAYFRAAGRTRPTEIAAGGLEAERFSPLLPPRQPDYDVVFVGRLVPIKRVDRLLKAAALLRKRFPALRVLVVGAGPERAALEALAAELGLLAHGCVHFAGAQADTETWLRRARVFVLTSESEGLSLALIEAMLCGLPAVVPRVGDLADLVIHGVNGFLVETPRPEAYAEAIGVLLACEEAQYRRLSTAARAAALRYERTAATERWTGIFAALAGEGAGACLSAAQAVFAPPSQSSGVPAADR